MYYGVRIGLLLKSIHLTEPGDSLYSDFFFFQAEDGIRDVAVTGVQTCALPICITASGADGITASGADSTTITRADGITASGADGITISGADGTAYRADSVVVRNPDRKSVV